MRSKKTERERVLFLAKWYPNRTDPMPGLFIRRHALSVSDKYNVAVLYVHPSSGLKRIEESANIDSNGICEVVLYYPVMQKRIPFITELVNSILFLNIHLRGLKILRNIWGDPDLIHVNVLTRFGIIALWQKLQFGIPYVITEHWTRYHKGMDTYKGFFRKLATRIVVKNASAIMPVSEDLKRSMLQHSIKNKNYVVIPNVVNTNMFIPVSKKKNDIKEILHVSCFEDKQKNISGILRVLKQLSLLRSDWHCSLVGDGIHFDRLRNYAEEIGFAQGLITFTGLKENKELVSLMQNADFQLLFSRFENLPVVIPESYACGVPFLSSDVGGIREHMNTKLGKLVQSENETQLLEALQWMLDNAASFDKEYIRQYAIDHFSEKVIGNQIASVYKQAIE